MICIFIGMFGFGVGTLVSTETEKKRYKGDQLGLFWGAKKIEE